MTDTLPQQSLADYFLLLKAALLDPLIGLESLNKIERVARVFPSAMTSIFGFECPLSTPIAQADFAVWVDANEAGRRVLGDDRYPIKLPDAVQSHPVWQRVHAFSTLWMSGPIARQVNNLWLEFDMDGDRSSVPVPSCFFSPEAIYAPQDTDDAAHQWVTQTAIATLWGRAVPNAVERQLFRCIQALPHGAYIFQLGLMLSRAADFIRVCIRNISPDDMVAYLTQLGWPGAIAPLKSTLIELSPLVDRIDLDLDIGHSIGPKLGLECYLNAQPQANPRWPLFLNYLVEAGLCTPGKRDGLLAFPGYMRERDYPDCWPANSRRSPLLGTHHEVVFFRGVNHLKVVFDGDSVSDAKAYVGIKRAFLNSPLIQTQLAKAIVPSIL